MQKDLNLKMKANIDLPKLSKMVWDNVNQIQLSLRNHEGRVATLPAIYGVAACVFFPVLSFATLYSLVKADVRIIIEKR